MKYTRFSMVSHKSSYVDPSTPFASMFTLVQVDDAPDRADFLARFQPGGPYEGTIGIYRRNISAARIGTYDRGLVARLPPSVKWIAHNGAGYDLIDVHACKDKGKLPSRFTVTDIPFKKFASSFSILSLPRHPGLQHPRGGGRSHRHDGAVPRSLHPPPLFKGGAVAPRGDMEGPSCGWGDARSEHAHARYPRARRYRPPPCAPLACLPWRAHRISQPSPRRGRPCVVCVR